MNCFDCSKDLKGGFGFGDKPYIKFRCAECVIEKVDRESMLHGFNMIKEKTSGIVPPTKGYKKRFEKLLEEMSTINVIACYYLEKESR